MILLLSIQEKHYHVSKLYNYKFKDVEKQVKVSGAKHNYSLSYLYASFAYAIISHNNILRYKFNAPN